MCPQLYMNYKLRSVAHLPWRMLTYKALNTFIDDLFASVDKHSAHWPTSEAASQFGHGGFSCSFDRSWPVTVFCLCRFFACLQLRDHDANAAPIGVLPR